MQRIRTTLTKLHQDPAQTQVTSRVGSRLKKIITQQDYNDSEGKGRNQESHNTNMYSAPYPSLE